MAPSSKELQCNATAWHPQDFANSSAFLNNKDAIPRRRLTDRTAMLDTYPMPTLHQKAVQGSDEKQNEAPSDTERYQVHVQAHC